MAHTPGPWIWTPDDPTMLILHTGKDYIGENSIMWADRCKACADRDAQCGWPKKEDANLIAAAPALVEALGDILNSNAKPVHGIGGKEIKGFTLYLPKERYEQVKQALAQAKGE